MAKPVGKMRTDVSGDIAQKVEDEIRVAFPNQIKKMGADMYVAPKLRFRREKMVGDGGEGVMSPLSCRETPKDQVVG